MKTLLDEIIGDKLLPSAVPSTYALRAFYIYERSICTFELESYSNSTKETNVTRFLIIFEEEQSLMEEK